MGEMPFVTSYILTHGGRNVYGGGNDSNYRLGTTTLCNCHGTSQVKQAN